MIAQDREKIIIEEYTRRHNVSMIALESILEGARNKDMSNENYMEDIATNLKLFLYDMNGIYESMSESMELLWELKYKNE